MRVSFGKPFGDFAAVNFRYLPRLIDNGDDDTAPEMLMAAAFAEDSNVAEFFGIRAPSALFLEGSFFPRDLSEKPILNFRITSSL